MLNNKEQMMMLLLGLCANELKVINQIGWWLLQKNFNYECKDKYK